MTTTRILSLAAAFLLPFTVYAQSLGERKSPRPEIKDRRFISTAVENKIEEVSAKISDPKLRWMFQNCFPNTLDTTVHYSDSTGTPRTFVYTGDIHAMWLRDSGAQVFPYVSLCAQDTELAKLIAGTLNCQFSLICKDPYANAFNDGPTGSDWESDYTGSPVSPWVHERKWELDSPCYPIRLAYAYWKATDDTSVFCKDWLNAMELILQTFTQQQRKNGDGPYRFLRKTDRQLDTKAREGLGHPIKPVGLVCSSFRPSDDATQFEFLVPSNFFAVDVLRKAAEILLTVNKEEKLAERCISLADEISSALKQYAIIEHPVFGEIYAYEVDGFGNCYLMDDANVPSLLSLAYLIPSMASDPIYQNTRRFVWSSYNPYFCKGLAGEGIGSPHNWTNVIWPMSIIMKAFTAEDDAEIAACLKQLRNTDAETGFMHECFDCNDSGRYTRPWFAWANTLFGELIVHLADSGKEYLL